MNFTGFGFMANGKLEGPAIFFAQDERVFSYQKMVNGKPHGPGRTYLTPKDEGLPARKDAKEKVPMSGWVSYQGDFVDAIP